MDHANGDGDYSPVLVADQLAELKTAMSIPVEPPDSSWQIHPGIWGVLGASALSAGRVGVALVRGKFRKSEPMVPEHGNGNIEKKLDSIKDDIAVVRETMATRTDLQAVYSSIGLVNAKVDHHVEAHAEGKFNESK